jgi:hypothetical protein
MNLICSQLAVLVDLLCQQESQTMFKISAI